MAADPSTLTFNQGSPRDNGKQPNVNRHIEKLSCHVLKFVEEDTDSVKVPQWLLQRLRVRAGQPLCVQIHRKPGNLYFYDATRVELEPVTPNYLHLEEAYRGSPLQITHRIREALRRYKVLAALSEVELLIDGQRVKFKIAGMYPTQQLQCLNSRHDELQIDVQVTERLERLAALNAIALEK